jgi:hypothetical protein
MGFGAPTATTTTYTYSIRWAVAVCFGPVNKFVRLDYNSNFKNYVNYDPPTPISLQQNKKNIKYGKFYWGDTAQGPDSSLQVMHKVGSVDNTLNYRNIAYVSFHSNLGQSPSMPATTFTVIRYYSPLSGVYPNTFPSSYGLNPVQVLYDILTNNIYGFGLSATLIDSASFLSAGSTLGPPENISVGTAITGGELYPKVREILDWIDGELVYNEPTGKISLILHRKTTSSITINESDMRAKTFELTRPSWFATKNCIILNFMDIRRECDQNCVYSENLANFNFTGTLRVQEFNFDIFTDYTTAKKVCNRLLHKQSYPYSKVTFECFGTKGDSLQIFQPFNLSHAYYNMSNVSFRVTEKRREGPNVWKIEAVEECPALNYEVNADEDTEDPFYDFTRITWSYFALETYYRGFMILGYSTNQVAGDPVLNGFGITTSDSVDGNLLCDGFVSYPRIGTLTIPFSSGGGDAINVSLDRHFHDDLAAVTYILICSQTESPTQHTLTDGSYEIFKVSLKSSDDTSAIYSFNPADRGLEETPHLDHAIGDHCFMVNDRSYPPWGLEPEEPYIWGVAPHYSYPGPFYDDEDVKSLTMAYNGLLEIPHIQGPVTWTSGGFNGSVRFKWTRDNRDRPSKGLPSPGEGLDAYPMEHVGGVWRDVIVGWHVLHYTPATPGVKNPSTDPSYPYEDDRDEYLDDQDEPINPTEWSKVAKKKYKSPNPRRVDYGFGGTQFYIEVRAIGAYGRLSLPQYSPIVNTGS